jgi:hypothetical protein
MPDFWQFPTVSMGLGPIMAIYQARFLKYLHGRGLADTFKLRPAEVLAASLAVEKRHFGSRHRVCPISSSKDRTSHHGKKAKMGQNQGFLLSECLNITYTLTWQVPQ